MKNDGYNKAEIPELILKNNLYGLDIDDRAGQLSVLSVLLKAREYDKYIFNKDIVRNLNIMSIQESSNIDSLVQNVDLSEDSKKLLDYLNVTFRDAKEIGSLLVVENNDYSQLIKELENDNTIFSLELKKKVIPLIKQANILSNKYDVVVTNPPYLPSSKLDNTVKNYLSKYYSSSKSDFFAAFMENRLVGKRKYLAMINMHSWMFLGSFKELRKKILDNAQIINMIHLGARAFEEIGGEVVQTTSFVIKNECNDNSIGVYYRLVNIKNASKKIEEFKFNRNKYKYVVKQKELKKIPNYNIAYWIGEKITSVFENEKLGSLINAKSGIMTGDDSKWIRFWFEVKNNSISYNSTNSDDLKNLNYKFFPLTRGGAYRKWYGNIDSIINLYNDAYGIKNNGKNFRLRDSSYYFKDGITWTMITSKLSLRYVNKGILFGNGGPTIFANTHLKFFLGLLNSNIINNFMDFMNPTMNIVLDDIENIPIIIKKEDEIASIVDRNIKISKQDWDSFETSWNFENHPLIKWKTFKSDYADEEFKNNIESSYEEYKSNANAQFDVLKQNEEELNKIFIDIYGLQDELTSEESDKDVTIHKIFDNKEDIPEEMKNSQYALTKLDVIKSFISYAVGCMFGRYSLDEDGLIYAGGEFDSSKYKTFKADTDNVIPITENKYFEDDIVTKFVKFVEVVYGKNTLEENLDFIANTLGKRTAETSRDTIRRYFLNDFYADHLKTYQKRPIYWLFDSGKKNGFKALIYMHRYNDQTVSKIRLDYLHKMQQTYATELKDVEYKLSNDLTLSEKKELTKKQADLNAKILETNEYDEKVAHIADQRISIDLDDGVAVNYGKFSVKNPKTGKEESILANSKDIVKKTKNSKEE